jgi:hypothetical protein
VDDEKYIQQPCENLTIRVKPFILSEREKKPGQIMPPKFVSHGFRSAAVAKNSYAQ